MPNSEKIRQYSPELQELLVRVEAALIASGKRARKIAEQTGTDLVIVNSADAQQEQLEQDK